MKNILYLTILVTVISSCQTVLENVPVPEIPVKGVVFANINQLSNLPKMSLTKSKPIINESTNNDYEVIQNAEAKVYVQGKEYEFNHMFNDEYGHLGTVDLQSGDEVKLVVKTDDFGELTSSVIVPDEIPSYTVKLDSVIMEWETEYQLVIDIPITDDKEHYYRIEAFSDYGSDTVEAWSTKEYFTLDKVVDGSIRLSTDFYTWKSEYNGENPKLFILLSAITEKHYQYGKVYETYEPDNPFSEPTPLPSNVDGGLGIFTVSNSKLIKLN
ncbi:MAG: DUF4249 domain-containing protein [Bacteroidia bacterium]